MVGLLNAHHNSSMFGGMVILTRVEMRKAPNLIEPYCIKMDTYECRGRACDNYFAPRVGNGRHEFQMCSLFATEFPFMYLLLELSLLSSAKTIHHLSTLLSFPNNVLRRAQ